MEASADGNQIMSSVEAEKDDNEAKESDDEDVSDEEEEEEDDDEDEDDDDDDGEEEEGQDDDAEGEENDEDWDTEEDEDDDEEEEQGEDDDDEMLEVSDSDGETGDRCPICLNRFREQDLGTPESCDHAFCLECILEWSKNVNTCPVDRQVFRLILCRHGGENNIFKKVIIQDKTAQAKEEEDLTYCEVCDQCDREDRLLLCDGCDKGYHLDCLTPALNEVPVHEWFCPQCAQREVDDEEESVSHARPVRQVARTSVMERVRSAIEEIRVRRIRNLRQILSSSEDEDGAQAASGSAMLTPSTSLTTVKKATPKKPSRKTPRKYKKRKTKTKTKRKRKTTTKTTKKRKTTKRTKKGRKRKGRKGKKGRARTVKRSTSVTTVKSRIAGALGIENPPAGRTIPTKKSKLDKSLESSGPSLSIFGSKEELIHFDDDYNTDSPALRGSKYSRSALSSYKPIGRVPVIISEKKKKKIVINTTPIVAASSSLDLLGSIMQDQSKLHLDSKHVKIQRDGSLISKEKKKTSEEDQSSSKLFKSSFTAIRGGTGPSILNTLSSQPSDGVVEDMTEEYDPAHPTEEIDDEVKPKAEDKEDDKYDPAHPTDELDDVSDDEDIQEHVEEIQSQKIIEEDKKNKLKDSGKSESSRKVDKKQQKLKKDVEKDKGPSNKSVNAGHSDRKKSVKSPDVFKIEKDHTDQDLDNFEIDEDIPLCKEFTTPTKEKKPDPTPKTSPSIKITESGKKVSPSAIKPFEISKKSLYEKKKLYGGEIDFTEDVTFSDAGFENFEVNVKAIESVFKGTVSNKENEKTNEEANKAIVTEKLNKDENINADDNLKLSTKFVTSKVKSDKSAKEPKTMNERFRMLNEAAKDNDIVSLEEEDPIHEMRKLDKELDFELENSDIGKSKDWRKSKHESEREHRKSRRKVSIDRDEDGRVRHRKEGRDRKHDWDEVEEGEVEDEQQYRDRKRREKREKKKKAAEKERYYNDLDMQYGEIDNADSEIDTRIVVQVSQNTDSRTVWEEDEKIRKKKDKEEKERRKERHRDEERNSKKERKRKRHRSRSRSHDRRDRSKSRERKRSRSRERSKKKHKDRSRSKSFERSRKKKKKDRDRSRDKRRSRDKSEERVDIFGRSRSPFRRKDTTRDRDSLSPIYQTKYSAMKNKINDFQVSKSKKPKLDDEVILIEDDDDEDEIDENDLEETVKEKSIQDSLQQNEDSSSLPSSPNENHDKKTSSKVESISKIEVKESSQRDVSSDEREEDYDDEPEETEQFNYTDRDEYLSQHKHKQQHQNLIQIGMDGSTYDPANPTESSSPVPPPLPDQRITHTPTPPLPPLVGEFGPPLFPPPPPGPPPPGPPPPSVMIQDRPPIPAQLNGPHGQGMPRESPPMLIRGPPPLEQGPPQGMMHPRPEMSLPMNINVAPPGFHRGLPQTIRPQRQVIVNAFRPGMPRMQRLPNPNVSRFGFTTTADVVTPQYGMMSHPRPNIINGPYDGLPPPTEGPPPNLIPPHSHFAMGAELQPPPHHLLQRPDGPPPSNLVQIPVEVEEGHVGVPMRSHGPPVSSTQGSEPQLIHLGQMPGDHPPQLPIPLLPTSDPHPALVSIPHHAMSLHPPVISGPSALGSIPSISQINMLPPHVTQHQMLEPGDRFIENRTPPKNKVESILKMSKMNAHVNSNSTVIPGLDMVEHAHQDSKGSSGKPEKRYSQLEEISKLLNTQAKLILDNKNDKSEPDSKRNGAKDDGVFKVPLPPGTKSMNNKSDVAEGNEVIDMDMASPILEEGNIELPVSPQFDNLIDTDDWLEEVYDNKMQKNSDKSNSDRSPEQWDDTHIDDKPQKTSEKSDKTDNWMDIIINTPKKSVESAISEKLEKNESKDVKSNKEKVSTPSKVKDKDSSKKESPKKSVAKKQSSKENKHKSHHPRKHKHKSGSAKAKNLQQKAQVDADLDLDLDSQELTSAVDLTNKDKYLRKLHLQERVVEEVKMAIKPHYANKKIDKYQYKEIMRKAVPKICHSKSGDINPMKIKGLIEAYVDRFNKPKQGGKNTPDTNEPSPDLKSNGERAKTKSAR